MEGLAHIVSESLARHNFKTALDYRRLQWSKWSRCSDSFSLLLVPAQAGLFALGEEIVAPGEISATAGKRMLAVFHLDEANDLGMTLGRMFLPGHPLKQRLEGGRCFVRYAVVDDAAQRQSALASLQRWMASGEPAATLQSAPFVGGISQASEASTEVKRVEIDPPAALPAGF